MTLSQELVSISVGSYYGNRGNFLRFAIPAEHLRRIGDPDRVEIRGQPANGFIISPSENGLKLNKGALKGGAAYLQTTLAHFELSREERKRVSVMPEFDGDQMRIPALPAAWIKPTDEFKVGGDRKPAQDLPRIKERDTPPISSTVPPAKPMSQYEVPTDATMSDLQASLAVKLNEARGIIRNMEDRTGMKFVLDRNLRLVVAL